jgi:SAM-dependent methyltransferase
MINQKQINKCRICGYHELDEIITLNEMPFTDEFIPEHVKGKEFLGPITISICNKCGSSQNIRNTEMNEYYEDYTYTVKSSKFAMSFMKKLAEVVLSFPSKINIAKALEIGSGSGEQLLFFKNHGIDVLGVEPSLKLSDYANKNGVPTVCDFFDENSASKIIDVHGYFDIVLSSYTFDHIPTIDKVLDNIYQVLNNDGLTLIEVHDLDLIIERNEFCLFEHEHYTYLNKETMRSFLSRHGFQVLSFNLLPDKEKRANSLLVLAQKTNKISYYPVNLKIERKKVSGLRENILKAIKRLDDYLLKQSRDTKIIAYGAGGRGIMTIAALKNHDRFLAIVDKNPKDDNIISPKSNLPVYGIDSLKTLKPDKIIVFSFGYFQEIFTEVTSLIDIEPDNIISVLNYLKEDN